jgi:hypothetical protein
MSFLASRTELRLLRLSNRNKAAWKSRPLWITVKEEEETMQSLMKPMLFVVMTVLGVALAIVPAHAQSGSRVSANIPFDFSVGNTTLKAGSYTVEQLQSGIIAFSSDDEKEHRFALTVPGVSGNQSQEPHLVFARYGSETFLKKVFLSGDGEYHELLRSSREKELIKNRASGDELSLLIQAAR